MSEGYQCGDFVVLLSHVTGLKHSSCGGATDAAYLIASCCFHCSLGVAVASVTGRVIGNLTSRTEGPGLIQRLARSAWRSF